MQEYAGVRIVGAAAFLEALEQQGLDA